MTLSLKGRLTGPVADRASLPATTERKERTGPSLQEEMIARVCAPAPAPKVDTRIIPHRCAVTGHPFTVTYQRRAPDGLYEIERIDKVSGTIRRQAGRPAAKMEAFSAGEFDCTGRRCPWCGNASGIVQCGRCGQAVCEGRTERRHRRRYFRCHESCGGEGETAPYGHMHGGVEKARQSSTEATTTTQPAGIDRPAELPALSVPRLPGRR